MTEASAYRESGVSRDGFGATVEMRRRPHNCFDSALAEIGDEFERFDADPGCGAIVCAAAGSRRCC